MCFINSTCQPCCLSWVSQGCVQDLHYNFVEHFYRTIIEDETLFLCFCLVTLIWYWGVWYSFPLSSLFKATNSQSAECKQKIFRVWGCCRCCCRQLCRPKFLNLDANSHFSDRPEAEKVQRAANEAFSHNFYMSCCVILPEFNLFNMWPQKWHINLLVSVTDNKLCNVSYIRLASLFQSADCVLRYLLGRKIKKTGKNFSGVLTLFLLWTWMYLLHRQDWLISSVSSAAGVIAGKAVVCLTVKADFIHTHQFVTWINHLSKTIYINS